MLPKYEGQLISISLGHYHIVSPTLSILIPNGLAQMMDVIFLQFMSTDDGLLLMILKFAGFQAVVLIKSSETLIGFRATHDKGG